MTPADTSPPAQQRYSPIRWWVCALLFLATTLNYMDRQALSQMGVRIEDALGLNHEEYSRLDTAFSAAFAIGAITIGFIVDKFNVWYVYPLMVLGWSLAGVLTGYTTGFWTLLACRFMLGFFEAGNWPCGIRTTRAVMKPKERSLGNSIFQSGTSVGAFVTPFVVLFLLRWAEREYGPTSDLWKLPFRIIGCLGLVWMTFWLLTIPKRLLTPAPGPSADADSDAGAARYRDVLRDPRFWALLVMVIAINITWHTYRFWLPIYLQKVRGFSEEGMTRLTTAFYICADVGSISMGLLTLFLINRGMTGHGARMLVFAGCAGLALVGMAFPFVTDDLVMVAAALLYGFASLGLFPTYFALTQEISAKHQGKVTGTLGLGAHGFLAIVMYPVEGRIIQSTQSFDLVLAASGVFPLIAFGLMLFLWPLRPARSA